MSEVDLLKNWSTLNEHLHDLTEQQCSELLKKEKKGKKRVAFLIRIYGRFNTLRTERERLELVAK